MQGLQHEPNTEQQRSHLQTMSVNIRLCGSIPRKDMKDIRTGASVVDDPPCSLKACLMSPPSLWGRRRCEDSNINNQHRDTTSRKMAICDALNGIVSQNHVAVRGVLNENKPPLGPVLEPPSWAVPAMQETRLEPVCEAAGRHSSVDLTTRPCFRVGRNPHSDIPLNHGTSSRRHAMLFHHSNGSCYVVDCGSAHGTYVNGTRVPSPSNGGLVIPQKVKRGALIRFGGPGAPSFLLKSYEEQSPTSADQGELVRRNTRLNAMGMYDQQQSYRDSVCSTIQQALYVARKRSFDSIDETLPPPSSSFDDEDDSVEPCPKRARCSSPPLVEAPPLRLVSPELPIATKHRVSFSTAPPQLFYPPLNTPEEEPCAGPKLEQDG